MITFFRKLHIQKAKLHRVPLYVLPATVFILIGCKQVQKPALPDEVDKNVAAANAFLDAFYSFNPNKLQDVMSFAKE